MILPIDERRAYYQRFEEVLAREGLDYNVHMLPAGNEPTDFEEYWITNVSPPVRLFPAVCNSTPQSESGLPPLIQKALTAHAAEDGISYHVVLCGADWSAEKAAVLQSRIKGPPGVRFRVRTLDEFSEAGV